MTQADADELRKIVRGMTDSIYDRYPPLRPRERPQGYARGIDFYSREDLERIIATICIVYRKKGADYPDLINPRLYSEKLNSMKLLGWMKIPESGNKLLTASFIPPEARGLLRVPDVVWRSTRAVLPSNGSIPDGEYFLKSNHGCGFYQRIRYPLTMKSRRMLESSASLWLQADYGHVMGEWWYNVFEKAVFLERCVTRRNPSVVVLLFTFKGRVGLISFDEKLMDGSTRVNVMDPSFRLLAEQLPGNPLVTNFSLSDDMKKRLIAADEAVGRPFEAVRVDLIPGDDGNIYLNEVTFTNDAGIPFANRERDLHLGDLWGRCSFLDTA